MPCCARFRANSGHSPSGLSSTRGADAQVPSTLPTTPPRPRGTQPHRVTQTEPFHDPSLWFIVKASLWAEHRLCNEGGLGSIPGITCSPEVLGVAQRPLNKKLSWGILLKFLCSPFFGLVLQTHPTQPSLQPAAYLVWLLYFMFPSW